MKTIINIVLGVIILFCLIYPQFQSTPIPTDPDKQAVIGIFDSLGLELVKDENRTPPVFKTLTDVYNTIVESSNKTIGHPIHEINGMSEFGKELGAKVEAIVPDATVPITKENKEQLSKLFLKTAKGIK